MKDLKLLTICKYLFGVKIAKKQHVGKELTNFLVTITKLQLIIRYCLIVVGVIEQDLTILNRAILTYQRKDRLNLNVENLCC